ncbi:MAG: DNA mismatch repair protein MutS, partial [Planctomycetota bacterium]
TDRSYGIQVARLAGVPDDLITRAKAILADIEDDTGELAPRVTATQAQAAADGPQQLALFAPPPSTLEQTLGNVDIDTLTPLEALTKLKELQDLI